MSDKHARREERELWDEDAQQRDPQLNREQAMAGLRKEWERAFATNPYYRARYEAAGLSSAEMPALDEIPRTTKDDLRADVAANPPFGTHRSVNLESARRIGASTGTSGKPWLVLWTDNDMEAAIDVRLAYLWRAGVREGGRFSHSWPTGMYATGVLAGRDFLRAGVMEVPVGLPLTDADAEYHLTLWKMLRPTAFMLTSSQLAIYQAAADRSGVDLPALMAGTSLLYSEASCQFEGPRKQIEETYGVRLHNISGASEIPAYSLMDCRHHTGLHVPMGHHWVQVCDPDTGKEVPTGERGTIVVSSYGLDAFYLRYDLEDIVVATDEPCPCGETGQRYTYLGRVSDRAEIDGRMVLPIDVQLALFPLGAPEFRLTPGKSAALSVSVESHDSTHAASCREALEAEFGVPVDFTAVEKDSFERATFKPRRVAS